MPFDRLWRHPGTGRRSCFFDAGADFVQLHSGLVYSGPGLPKRINEAILQSRFGACASLDCPLPDMDKEAAAVSETTTTTKSHRNDLPCGFLPGFAGCFWASG